MERSEESLFLIDFFQDGKNHIAIHKHRVAIVHETESMLTWSWKNWKLLANSFYRCLDVGRKDQRSSAGLGPLLLLGNRKKEQNAKYFKGSNYHRLRNVKSLCGDPFHDFWILSMISA